MLTRKDAMSPIQTPRVWGIGLTRTGTTSLHNALKILGYQSVHWPTLHALLSGDLQAATDESVAAVYRYLDHRFPGSKFILTERSETEWLRSAALHRAEHAAQIDRLVSSSPGRLSVRQRLRRIDVIFTQMTIYGTITFEETKFLAGYRRHVDQVLQYFTGRNDLLRMRICDGHDWSVLVPFLQSTNSPRCAFPHANGAVYEPNNVPATVPTN